MTARRWIRKSAKWTCTIAAVMVVGAAVFSLFRSAVYEHVSKDGETALIVEVRGGRLDVVAMFGYVPEALRPYVGWEIQGPDTWSWGMHDSARPFAKWRGGIAWIAIWGSSGQWWAGVTLLYPFLLTAVPAGLLWWKDLRRFGPGRCPNCGYDRAGLAAGTACPECGKPAPSAPKAETPAEPR
jgi:hypothetical protein